MKEIKNFVMNINLRSSYLESVTRVSLAALASLFSNTAREGRVLGRRFRSESESELESESDDDESIENKF